MILSINNIQSNVHCIALFINNEHFYSMNEDYPIAGVRVSPGPLLILFPLNNLQAVLVRQFRELGVRLGLIPVGDRGDIVLERQIPSSRAPAQGLDRYFQVLLEPDRVHDVPAVEAEALLDVVMSVSADDLRQARIRRRELSVADDAVGSFGVEIVRAAEIILGPGSADRRKIGVAV